MSHTSVPVNPGVTTQRDVSDTTTPFINVSNIAACDNTYATANLSQGSNTTTRILATSYDLSTLNNSGILTGLEVHIEAFTNVLQAEIDEVRFFRRSLGTGVDRAATPTSLTTSEVDYQYGGTGDLWGTSFRTVGDFAEPDTGISVRARWVSGSPVVSIDCVTLICYFNESRPLIMRFALSPRRATLPLNRNQRSRI